MGDESNRPSGESAEPVDHFADVADEYDEHTEPPPVEMIDELERLARATPVDGRPRAYELAVGTGRVALPLAARGVDVVGVDVSPAMLAELDRKLTGPIPADHGEVAGMLGDMATTDVTAEHGRFGVAFLVYNTINNLTTQAGQAAAFASAARHLVPGGSFVVEVGVPSIWQLEPGSREFVFTDEPGYRGVDEYTDFVGQRFFSHHTWVDDDGAERTNSVPFRWVWPSELDLMARLAGMELIDRWNDWDRTPFTDDSTFHVSRWQLTS